MGLRLGKGFLEKIFSWNDPWPQCFSQQVNRFFFLIAQPKLEETLISKLVSVFLLQCNIFEFSSRLKITF